MFGYDHRHHRPKSRRQQRIGQADDHGDYYWLYECKCEKSYRHYDEQNGNRHPDGVEAAEIDGVADEWRRHGRHQIDDAVCFARFRRRQVVFAYVVDFGDADKRKQGAVECKANNDNEPELERKFEDVLYFDLFARFHRLGVNETSASLVE